MIKSKLKIRSAAKDIVLSVFTGGIWGIWVLWSLYKEVSVIESKCNIKFKPKLEPFDVFLILVYGVLFIFPLATTAMISNDLSNHFSSFEIFSSAISFSFQQLPILALGAIWIGARHIRRRILKIVEIEDFKSGYFAVVGFSWVAIIFFAFTLAIAPYVTLYRTISMYNLLAENFNE